MIRLVGHVLLFCSFTLCIKTDEGSKPEWFTVPDPERDFPVDGTENFAAVLKAPPEAPAGDHRFQLQMVGVKNPDEMRSERFILIRYRDDRTAPIRLGVQILQTQVSSRQYAARADKR